jgi:hypothetical protein
MERTMSEESKYDLEELVRLWKLDYQQLARAPGEASGRLREARFVMQAKVAWETRLYIHITTAATVVMSLATIVMAVNTFTN